MQHRSPLVTAILAATAAAKPGQIQRVGASRVFYDVSGSTVEILAILPKSEADLWLARYASPQ
jgi:mRNA interferase RelE/StbE